MPDGDSAASHLRAAADHLEDAYTEIRRADDAIDDKRTSEIHAKFEDVLLEATETLREHALNVEVIKEAEES